LGIFPDEHDSGGQSVKAIAWSRYEIGIAICAQDFDDRVEVVSACSVDGNTSGLINDDESLIFVDDSDGKACNRRFVAVGSVGDDLAVLDDGFGVGSDTIDSHKALF
jgi:hypothetical protein